jgi:hypothetical protein
MRTSTRTVRPFAWIVRVSGPLSGRSAENDDTGR